MSVVQPNPNPANPSPNPNPANPVSPVTNPAIPGSSPGATWVEKPEDAKKNTDGTEPPKTNPNPNPNPNDPQRDKPQGESYKKP